MCNVFEVAKKLCEARDWQVSNLALQKMLYITQVFYLGLNNKHLFKSSFEAWDYGPVIPDVYHKFKIFGSGNIEAWAFPSTPEKCDSGEVDFIHKIAKLLSDVTPSQLVDLTHRKNTAWYKNYQPGMKDIIIPERDMFDEFRKVWLKNDTKTNHS